MKLSREDIVKYITWMVVMLVYCLLIYKLVNYDNYAQLVADFSHISLSRWILLSIAIALMPINLSLEAIKWRYAISPAERITIKDSYKATLIGQIGALITPNRLGDFPTRSLLMKKENRLNGTILGFVSSWGQTITILTVGATSASFYIQEHNSFFTEKYIYITISACVMLILTFCALPFIGRKILTYNIGDKTRDIANCLSGLNSRYIAAITALSAIRYAVYCTQFWLFLNFCNIDLNAISATLTIPIVYLLSTITPSITPSVAATNSSYAIVIISCFSDNAPAIALGATLTWIVNCCVPLLIGTVIFNKKNRSF